MYKLFIAVIVGILSVSLGEPQYEIHAGNCREALPKDLVFKKVVHLSKIPLVVRRATEEWHGDDKIYCMSAVSQTADEKDATVDIVDGGVNHTFATFKFKTARGRGLEYLICVYANTTANATV